MYRKLLNLSRFIPAHAGNGSAKKGAARASPVHPRACGERAPSFLSAAAVSGSSPRVRGTGLSAPPLSRLERFIPARAGNGKHKARRNSRRSVHPRACGERRRRRLKSLWNFGSSPRVRGTARMTSLPMMRLRFIPARAGNGRVPLSCGSSASVHPRACGERERASDFDGRLFGSSPRVRGTGSH